MVAYGPNMRGIHTTHERLQISSTGKVWSILKRTFATLPPKGDHHDPV
jgi:di/tripeptidase